MPKVKRENRGVEQVKPLQTSLSRQRLGKRLNAIQKR